ADSSSIRIGTGLLGQPVMIAGRNRNLLAAKQIVSDGLWHNMVVSKDSSGKLRLFVDAGPPAVSEIPSNSFTNVVGMHIGNPVASNDFAIDELRLLRIAYRSAEE